MYEVAPRAGAWIETELDSAPSMISRPPCDEAREKSAKEVAPRAGAWIETSAPGSGVASFQTVAPRAGAWIETFQRQALASSSVACRPPCGGVD